MTPQWLTSAEVADQIRLTVHEVRQMLASGEIPASDVSRGTKGGRRYRVKQTDLDRWMASRQVAAAGSSPARQNLRAVR